jgi:hypothetical protein
MARGHRYDPDRPWGGTAANWFEDPDAIHALNDYGAAVRDLPPEDRPDFAMDDWRDGYAQPTTPAWASDAEPEPEPVCSCGALGCPGAYGGRCGNARDPYEPGGWG